MKGYRTIIVNIIAAIAALVTIKTGIPIPPELQVTFVAGVFGSLNIFMRFITDTPVGSSSEPYNPAKHNGVVGHAQTSLLCSLALMSCMFASCAWIASNPATANLVVNQITHRVIERSSNPQALAKKVLTVVDTAQLAANQDPGASLQLLRNRVIQHEDVASLSPADKDLVVLLVDQLLAEVESRINDIERDVDQMTALRDVLSTVRRAAKTYEL